MGNGRLTPDSIEHVEANPDEGLQEHWAITVSFVDERGNGMVDQFYYDPRTDILDELLEAHGADHEETRRKIEQAVRPPKQRQTLPTSGALYQQVATIKKALVDANDPVPLFFRRQGRIVTVHRTDDDRPTFRAIPDVASLRAIASWTADWQNGNGEMVAAPAVESSKVVFSNPPDELPAVAGIVTAPILRPDGTRLRQPGYDARTRLFYERPPGMSPIEYATTDEAKDVIREMVRGFPFDGANARTGSSAANYLAWLLTPAIRPLLPQGANVPIAVFEAALPGSGKDLLARTSSLIYTGSAGAVRQAPDSNDEWRKQITSMLLAGQQVHVFSNMSGILDSDALAGVVTSPYWSDRKLGASEDVSFAVNLTLAITANNLTLGRDFPRRTYPILLDAQRQDPAARTFAIPDLDAWIVEHRNELLGAVLSLCELWIRAGRKEAEITWSSYTPWARIVGGILENAGVHRFLANRDDRVGYDPDDEELATLLAAIHTKVGEQPTTMKDIIAKVGLSADVWPDRFIGYSGAVVVNAQKLGMWLGERSKRYAGGYRLDVRKNHTTNANEAVVTR